MRKAKKPPPDSVANMLGRISALKRTARQHASMAAKDGGDYDRALAKELRAQEPTLKKYRQRLEKARKAGGRAVPTPKTEKAPSKAPQTPQEPSKKRSSGTVPKDYNDLLATLESF